MPKKQIPEIFKDPNSKLPYSAVNQIGNHFHFSGQIPNLDENKKLTSSDLAEQTREVLAKIKDMLDKCGLKANDMFDVIILFIGEADAYQTVNQVYAAWLEEEGAEDKPNRVAYGVAWLPFGASVEIKFNAVKQD